MPRCRRAGDRITREDHRQRDVAAAVARPAAEHGQEASDGCSVSTTFLQGAELTRWGRSDHVEERAQLAQLVEHRAGHPQGRSASPRAPRARRDAHAQRGGHAIGRPKAFDEHGHLGALHVFEEQGEVTAARALGHAVGDLGDLEIA